MKLYSSSILLAYDARYLRNNMELQKQTKEESPPCPKSKSPRLPDITDPALNSPFNWPINSPKDRSLTGSNAQEMYKQVQRSHSSQNNYDEVENATQ